MIVFPAIDIYDGNAVRLVQGKFSDVTIYGDPLEIAERWQALGAQWLHVVDLNAARDGFAVNLSIVEKICAGAKVPVQFGGGVRTFDDAQARLDAGVSRVIFGTAAVTTPDEVAKAVAAFGVKIAAGIDARGGFVSIHGWTRDSSVRAMDCAEDMKRMGVETIIYTDIATEGLLGGPNLAAMREMNRCGLNVIASGGVAVNQDLHDLRDIGLYGAIVGKALYTGGVDTLNV